MGEAIRELLGSYRLTSRFDEAKLIGSWERMAGKPIARRRKSIRDIPARTPESDALSKDLLRRGFRFVGSTICYAFMQATGLVDDHAAGCFRRGRK